MFTDKNRVCSLLNSAIQEMEFLVTISEKVQIADDFVTDISGMVLFRACGMSLQYITESFVKIRNICGIEFFKNYSTIPWNSVFGMRNFLAHDYGEVDAEGIFGTVKEDIPALLPITIQILSDVNNGHLDRYFDHSE